MNIVVADTGPLLHLSQAHSLDLLHLSGAVHIPSAVAVEAVRLNPVWASALPSWITISQLHAPHSAQAQLWEQSGLSQRGEAEALALALQLQAGWFLTDDTAARVLANSLGVEVHGSLGVVLLAAAAQHLNRVEAENALNQLAASSLWLSARVLQEARNALDQIAPPTNP